MSNTQPLALTPPRVDTLPDVPGGQVGLLPVAATGTNLKVEFDQWPASNPTLAKETVRLFWDDREGARRDWSAPIAPDDLYVMLPATLLYQGGHQLYYEVTKWDGNKESSSAITLTVDKEWPVLGGVNDPPIPPADLIDNRVTLQYLDAHEQLLTLTVPAWDADRAGPRPGDVLTWYWDREPSQGQVAGSKVLSETDMSLSITVDGDLIKARGDGTRYVMFQVKDRAGNSSAQSRPLSLEVKTVQPPRNMPRPRLKGTSNTYLDPIDGLDGVMLEIPVEAVLDETDTVFMQWGTPGTPGAWRMPVDIEVRECRVPPEYVPMHLDSTLEVYYEALDYLGTVHTSTVLSLRVQALAGLPTLQCEGIIGGVVSIGEIQACESLGVATRLQIGQWPFIASGQLIKVVAGMGSNAHVILPPSPVLPGEPVALGTLKASDLQPLTPGPLKLQAHISFDEQQHWMPLKAGDATLTQ